MQHPTPPFLIALGAFALIGLMALMAGCGDSSPISPAKAQVTNDVLTWVAPTQNVDGSLLAPTDILQYRILSSKVAGGPYTLINGNVAPNLLTFTISPRPAGRQCYVMRTVNLGGDVSANSNEACTTKCALGTQVNTAGDCIVISKPKPPSNVQGT